MQKFFISANGDFIGSFDGAEPPQGSVEVPLDHLPENGSQKFKNGSWSTYTKPADPITAEKLSEILKTKGVLNAQEIETIKGK